MLGPHDDDDDAFLGGVLHESIECFFTAPHRLLASCCLTPVITGGTRGNRRRDARGASPGISARAARGISPQPRVIERPTFITRRTRRAPIRSRYETARILITLVSRYRDFLAWSESSERHRVLPREQSLGKGKDVSHKIAMSATVDRYRLRDRRIFLSTHPAPLALETNGSLLVKNKDNTHHTALDARCVKKKGGGPTQGLGSLTWNGPIGLFKSLVFLIPCEPRRRECP